MRPGSEAEGFWTKDRDVNLWFKLPLAVAITLLHSGWYNLVLFAVLALGGLIALVMRRRAPAAPLSILPKQ
jgi:hypothetical protein